jgi:hypothetical protein
MDQVSFTGTQAAINAALASMLVSTGADQGDFTINVTASPIAANTYYNAANNHFYQYVPSTNISWTNALAAAAGKTLFGSQGYLVTITTADENNFVKSNINATNIWIGASDAATEGVWQWVSGPEAGTTFWVGNASGSTVLPLNYASWKPGEPNNSGDEDYAVTNYQTNGLWNDFRNQPSQTINGYLVEYSPPFANVSTQQKTASVFNGTGGNGGDGGDAGLGGTGGSGLTASAGADGGTGGRGGVGGTGATGKSGGTGGYGGTGGDGGTSGTGTPGTIGSAGDPGSAGVVTSGGVGGAGGANGTGGTV